MELTEFVQTAAQKSTVVRLMHNIAWGVSNVGPMDELRESKAVVMCPGCDAAMKPIEQKPITEGLVDVTYRCEKCQMTTIRTVRPDDQKKL